MDQQLSFAVRPTNVDPWIMGTKNLPRKGKFYILEYIIIYHLFSYLARTDYRSGVHGILRCDVHRDRNWNTQAEESVRSGYITSV
jgi:hypothetical protein